MIFSSISAVHYENGAPISLFFNVACLEVRRGRCRRRGQRLRTHLRRARMSGAKHTLPPPLARLARRYSQGSFVPNRARLTSDRDANVKSMGNTIDKQLVSGCPFGFSMKLIIILVPQERLSDVADDTMTV